MTRDTLARPEEPDTSAPNPTSDTTTPATRTAEPTTTPGPGTRGHASAAREQARAHDPSAGVHPLVVAAVVAVVGALVLVWQPFGAEPPATATTTSNVIDIGALQQEKVALVARSSSETVAPRAALEAAAILAQEKATVVSRRDAPLLHGAVQAAALLAQEKAQMMQRAARSVEQPPTPEEEKQQLVGRRS